MQPIKAKELIPQTASMLGLPEQEVGSVVKFYWKTVRQTLSSLPEPVVQIANLGEFQVKHWLLEDKIRKTEKTLQHLRNRTKPDNKVVLDLENQLIQLRGVKDLQLEEEQRKLAVKAKRGSL